VGSSAWDLYNELAGFPLLISRRSGQLAGARKHGY